MLLEIVIAKRTKEVHEQKRASAGGQRNYSKSIPNFRQHPGFFSFVVCYFLVKFPGKMKRYGWHLWWHPSPYPWNVHPTEHKIYIRPTLYRPPNHSHTLVDWIIFLHCIKTAKKSILLSWSKLISCLDRRTIIRPDYVSLKSISRSLPGWPSRSANLFCDWNATREFWSKDKYKC